MKKKVTNNHDAPLAVAGVAIAAGATVGIDADALHKAMNSKALQSWVKLEVIEIEGLEEVTSDEPEVPTIPGVPTLPTAPATDREALEAKAKELGVKGNVGKMKDETLAAKVKEAEEAAE